MKAYKFPGSVKLTQLSDVEYGGVKHLFVAMIYPDRGPDLKTFAKVGEQLLRTVRVPATPA
jgi:hypothetical protein